MLQTLDETPENHKHKCFLTFSTFFPQELFSFHCSSWNRSQRGLWVIWINWVINSKCTSYLHSHIYNPIIVKRRPTSPERQKATHTIPGLINSTKGTKRNVHFGGNCPFKMWWNSAAAEVTKARRVTSFPDNRPLKTSSSDGWRPFIHEYETRIHIHPLAVN